MLRREQELRRRIQAGTWILILGLFFSGATALPLHTELNAVARWLHVENISPDDAPSDFAKWILIVRDGLQATYQKYPFVAYGTDWLAFAHFAIAIVYFGALRHPIRSIWLYTWGMIVSVLVIPWALIVGEVRDIPVYWRLIDSSFGAAGFLVCWLCQRWTRELEVLRIAAARFD